MSTSLYMLSQNRAGNFRRSIRDGDGDVVCEYEFPPRVAVDVKHKHLKGLAKDIDAGTIAEAFIDDHGRARFLTDDNEPDTGDQNDDANEVDTDNDNDGGDGNENADPLAGLEISDDAINALKDAGFATREDLAKAVADDSDVDLTTLQGIGKATVARIVAFVTD